MALGVLDRDTMLVHAGDVTAAEIAAIARSGAAVVFCPGTHVYFCRPPHPLPALLEAGVPTGLGTDSSASNTGLSIAAEMRTVRRLFPELPARTIWQLGTGALLDRFFPGAGSVEPGATADLAVTDLSPAGSAAAAAAGDPLEAFLALDLDAPAALTLCAGASR